MTYQVLRPFEGERRYEAGERVSADGWRNVRQLVAQRYIQPLADGAPRKAKEKTDAE